jgi:chaperonin cofactor prefoldin
VWSQRLGERRIRSFNRAGELNQIVLCQDDLSDECHMLTTKVGRLERERAEADRRLADTGAELAKSQERGRNLEAEGQRLMQTVASLEAEGGRKDAAIEALHDRVAGLVAENRWGDRIMHIHRSSLCLRVRGSFARMLCFRIRGGFPECCLMVVSPSRKQGGVIEGLEEAERRLTLKVNTLQDEASRQENELREVRDPDGPPLTLIVTGSLGTRDIDAQMEQRFHNSSSEISAIAAEKANLEHQLQAVVGQVCFHNDLDVMMG